MTARRSEEPMRCADGGLADAGTAVRAAADFDPVPRELRN